MRTTRQRAPVVFFTDVRKVEHVGNDCIRIYCCVSRDGMWEDRVLIEIPMGAAATCCRFVMQALEDIHNDLTLAETETLETAH